ncbi:MAG: ribonuclease [Clostridia bacterium]|nr:ribonuclease [Clostridia bacterium]
MRKTFAVIIAALLAFSLLFTACAPPDISDLTGDQGYTEENFDLSVVDGDPTDESPTEERTASPPETDGSETDAPETEEPTEEPETLIDEEGSFTSKDDVALYIHTYGRLPKNFITKSEAEKLGWSGGSLEPYAPGKCIGGGRFGNYEGLLPEKPGRTYTECDIDTLGKRSRGAKRIVFSNDGLIYYTDDHYESFTLLYGEE